MTLTEDILRAAYAYLAETPPFNKWNLPDAEDVKFVVGTRGRDQGECRTVVYSQGTPDERCDFTIMISKWHHNYTFTLLQTMAHEMVHVHQRHNCINRGKRSHGTDFKALALEVCECHGFDPGQF